MLTTYGVIPVTQIVQGGLDNILTSSTELMRQLRKINNQLNADFSTLNNTPGWELLEIPNKAMLLIARPAVSVTDNVQYAFQLHSLAWSRLLDIPGKTFGRRLNETYAGTSDAKVLRVFDGYTDKRKIDGSGAVEVRARLTPAFSYFGNPGIQKQAGMIRCNFLSARAPGYAVTMNVDFAITTNASTAIIGASVGSLWDSTYWDSGFWSGGMESFADWRVVEGLGYALAPTIYTSALERTVLASIEYMNTNGGPL